MKIVDEEFEKQKAVILEEAKEIDRNIASDQAMRARQLVQVLAVVPSPDENPLAPDIQGTWERLGVPMNKNGNVAPIVDHAYRALEGLPEFKDFAWWDEFHLKFFTTWHGVKHKGTEPREWADSDDLELMLYFQRALGLSKITEKITNQAMRIFAGRRVKNEPRDWMDSLKWDGEPRIDRFFTEFMGAKESLYVGAASLNFWTGLAARIYRPGCKLDNMVVLYGSQGVFKSTAINLIGGKWATELHESISKKDFYVDLQGKMICEISELGSFKNSEVAAIKAAISRPSDRFRVPYGRASADHPRKCIFVGTTNDPHFLKDDTGARRFWPISVGKIDKQRIQDEREQLFAEAVARFKSGALWYLMPSGSTEEIQEQHRHADDWEGPIAEWLIGRAETTSLEVAKGCLEIHVSDIDQVITKRICRVLGKLGWERGLRKVNGKPLRVWFKVGSENDVNMLG